MTVNLGSVKVFTPKRCSMKAVRSGFPENLDDLHQDGAGVGGHDAHGGDQTGLGTS